MSSHTARLPKMWRQQADRAAAPAPPPAVATTHLTWDDRLSSTDASTAARSDGATAAAASAPSSFSRTARVESGEYSRAAARAAASCSLASPSSPTTTRDTPFLKRKAAFKVEDLD